MISDFTFVPHEGLPLRHRLMRTPDDDERAILRRGRTSDTAALEQRVRRLAAEGRVGRAAGRVLKAHGSELFGFLVAVLDNYRGAAHVYADAAKAMERALAGARWTCSLRTLAYSVVRRELARHLRANAARLGEGPAEIDDAEKTLSCRPVALSMAVARLRGRLADEDRELLILRVDRQLEWEDIAISSLGWDAPRDALAKEVERVVARMDEIRKQLAEVAVAYGPDRST
jgi:DNA-directed RNA polymerase specialized sigma24 family protein